MPRVKKIKVGGTNYDIAHEGTLKNSGFEVVTELPTTGLFEGREVVYQGIKYVYNNGWRSQYSPVNMPKGVTLRSSTEELTNAATVIELQNFELSQISELLNKSLFISNNTNVVKQSERLYELIDDETGDITVVSGIVNPVLGRALRYTAINPSGSLENLHLHILKTNTTSAAYCVYIPQNVRLEKAIYKIEYYIYTNATGDGDYNNKANYEWKTVFEKELNQKSVVIYPCISTVYWTQEYTYTYIYNVRVSVKPTTKIHQYDIMIEDIDVLYYGGLSHRTPVDANRLINFDAKIEPTQTSTEFKSTLWLCQYLVQGVNWLKANKVSLSVYNAKVAELVQADSANNAYIQSVKEELSNTIFPWYVNYNGVDYPARLQGNWLQIYRNEVWANLLYLASQEPIQPTEVVQITSFGNLSWYNEQVSEYEIDSNTTFELLDGKVLIASQLLQCPANQLTLNLFPIPSGRYSKGALDNVISDLKGKNFAVFVENDIDAILSSGNDFCVRIKISKVPTYKAIIECYVAR